MHFRALALAGAALAGFARHDAGVETAPSEATPDAPVVLVVVDTLRADHVSAYGYARPTTPQLDRLAAEGLLVERAFAQSSWTKPATASLLTGQFPSVHGVMQVYSSVPDGLPTLAERLRARGYRTAAFVANSLVADANAGYDRGFERFSWEDLGAEGERYPRADALVSAALAWLDESERDAPGAPFHLYLHLMDPHAPYHPPEPYRARFDRGFASTLDGDVALADPPLDGAKLSADDIGRLIDLYDGEIAFADAQLGRLFDALRARGIWERAWVVVVADHGEEFADHGGLQHGPTLYQELVHVPLLVKPPGAGDWPRGERFREPAMQVDVVPTLLDGLGLAIPAELPGASLFARRRADDAVSPRAILGEVDSHGAMRAMVVEGWDKLVLQRVPEPVETSFDLWNDPGERHTHALSPERCARLRAHFDAYAAEAKRRSGFALELVNGSDEPLDLELALATEHAPLSALQPRSVEIVSSDALDRDVPLGWFEEEWDGVPLNVLRVRLRTPPGTRDGFDFIPAEEDARVFLRVRRGGELVAPELVRAGAARRAGTRWPIVLERGADEWLATDPSRAEADGVRLYVWKRRSRYGRSEAPSEATLRELKGLGYAGDGE